ncbi:MAG: hypothetical protein QW474_00085 [Candidatus Aenigmatarchaeota archaeon]
METAETQTQSINNKVMRDKDVVKILKAMLGIIQKDIINFYDFLHIYQATNLQGINPKDVNDKNVLTKLLSDFLNLISKSQDPIYIFEVLNIKSPTIYADLYNLVVELYNTQKFNFNNITAEKINEIINTQNEIKKINETTENKLTNNKIYSDGNGLNNNEKDNKDGGANNNDDVSKLKAELNKKEKELEEQLNKLRNEVLNETMSNLNTIINEKIKNSNNNKETQENDRNTEEKTKLRKDDEQEQKSFKTMKFILGGISILGIGYLIYSMFNSKKNDKDIDDIIKN